METGTAVRASGITYDKEAAAAKRARGMSVTSLAARDDGADGANGPGDHPSSPMPAARLLDRLKLWLKAAIAQAQSANGPQYMPGRQAFVPGLLDATQFAALAKIVGAGGVRQLDEVLTHELRAAPFRVLHEISERNMEALSAIASSITAGGDTSVVEEMRGLNVDGLASACRSVGVVVSVRSLFHMGVRAAKADIHPIALQSFVSGIGEQQLPDGVRAGARLREVTGLLSSFGMLGGPDRDTVLLETIAASCEMAADTRLWAMLPYALGLLWSSREWSEMAVPKVDDAALGANMHCLVHGLHAILSALEPFMPEPRGRAGPPPTDSQRLFKAHHRFLEVSSLYLTEMRRGMHEGKPAEVAARERNHAAIVLVLEQLVQLADPMTYGDLQGYLSHSLVLASYVAVAKPITITTELEHVGSSASAAAAGAADLGRPVAPRRSTAVESEVETSHQLTNSRHSTEL